MITQWKPAFFSSLSLVQHQYGAKPGSQTLREYWRLTGLCVYLLQCNRTMLVVPAAGSQNLMGVFMGNRFVWAQTLREYRWLTGLCVYILWCNRTMLSLPAAGCAEIRISWVRLAPSTTQMSKQSGHLHFKSTVRDSTALLSSRRLFSCSLLFSPLSLRSLLSICQAIRTYRSEWQAPAMENTWLKTTVTLK